MTFFVGKSKIISTVLTSDLKRILCHKISFCTKTEPCSSSELTNSKFESKPHVPVMVEQVLKYLNPTNGKIFLDMTFGAGGHTKELLKAEENITVLALDRDSIAYSFAKEMQKSFPKQVIPLNGKFSDVPRLLQGLGIQKDSLDGVLFDVGCSSMQLDNADHGFSYLRNAPLDMRMCRDHNQPTAADVINSLDAKYIARILKVYGEVKQSKKIAQAIIDSKYMMQPIKTTRQLAMLVRSVYTKDQLTSESLTQASHIAAQVFQALRIFVNNELNELDYGVEVSHHYLKENGTMVALSFHSLEDRIVKRHFNSMNMDEPPASRTLREKFKNAGKTFTNEELSSVLARKWKVLTKKPIVPTEEEIRRNSRSRSAKLRAAQKLNLPS